MRYFYSTFSNEVPPEFLVPKLGLMQKFASASNNELLASGLTLVLRNRRTSRPKRVSEIQRAYPSETFYIIPPTSRD